MPLNTWIPLACFNYLRKKNRHGVAAELLRSQPARGEGTGHPEVAEESMGSHLHKQAGSAPFRNWMSSA